MRVKFQDADGLEVFASASSVHCYTREQYTQAYREVELREEIDGVFRVCAGGRTIAVMVKDLEAAKMRLEGYEPDLRDLCLTVD